MAEKEITRRLAAILAADMAGYSRLVEANETDTLARQKAHRAALIDPKIAEHNGRIVKTIGDGLLVEFASAVDAVQCAVEIQRAMVERETGVAENRRIRYRIGINIGDIVIDNGDIFGDGVNVAARIEGLANPGGISVSDMVYQSIAGKLNLAFDDAGLQSVKNLKKAVHVWKWRADDAVPDGADEPAAASVSVKQEIRFCTAKDGARIAYAIVGQGPHLVKAPNWLNHLEHDWQSPIWRHLLRELAANNTLVRFDQRGTGLSDREVPEISFESMVSDLATVVDAVGLERFPLLGISQGCAYSIAYAVQHPERVSRLVLYGGFPKGLLRSEVDKQRFEIVHQMILQGWGQDNPAFRQFFTSLFMPEATKEQMDWFNKLQRVTASPENSARLFEVNCNINVVDLLAQVSVPTLVLHCRGDGAVSFEAGRMIAASIPGARFVPLEGKNHLILETEPAWPRFIDEVSKFLSAAE